MARGDNLRWTQDVQRRAKRLLAILPDEQVELVALALDMPGQREQDGCYRAAILNKLKESQQPSFLLQAHFSPRQSLETYYKEALPTGYFDPSKLGSIDDEELRSSMLEYFAQVGTLW